MKKYTPVRFGEAGHSEVGAPVEEHLPICAAFATGPDQNDSHVADPGGGSEVEGEE